MDIGISHSHQCAGYAHSIVQYHAVNLFSLRTQCHSGQTLRPAVQISEAAGVECWIVQSLAAQDTPAARPLLHVPCYCGLLGFTESGAGV